MDYNEYLRSDLWKERRYAALERAGFKCQLCGEIDSLEVHHRTYDRLGHEYPDDLIVICKGHHWEEHIPKVDIVIDKKCAYAIGLNRKIERAEGSLDKKGLTTQELRNEIIKLKELLNRNYSKCDICKRGG